MTKETRILIIKNRIHLLNQRGSESARIVKKLERELRNLER